MFVVKHHRFHRLERSSERSPASWIVMEVMDLRQKKKGRIAGKHGNLPEKKMGIYMNLLEHAALPCFTHQKFGFKLSSEIERGV